MEQLTALLGITSLSHGSFTVSPTATYLAVITIQMSLNGSSLHCPRAAWRRAREYSKSYMG